MKFVNHYLSHYLLPVTFFLVVALVAFFAQQSRDWLLPILFLLLPFIDFKWRIPEAFFSRRSLICWVLLTITIVVLLLKNSEILGIFTMMVLLAALPEEWFFRGYLQKRLGNSGISVVIVSLVFSFMHYITQNSVSGWFVFVPSLFFGWVYKKTNDLVVVVVLHALSNLIYLIYFQNVSSWRF